MRLAGEEEALARGASFSFILRMSGKMQPPASASDVFASLRSKVMVKLTVNGRTDRLI